MSKFAVTYRGTIYPWQCDHMGHMNVMWYVGKFDEATWQLLAALGLTRTRLGREFSGMAAVEQHLEYKRELCAGDIVTVRSAVLEVKDKSIRFHHEMRNDDSGELAASAITVGVYLDTVARKARSLPADVRERASVMLSCWDTERSGYEPVAAHGPGPVAGPGDTPEAAFPAAMMLGPCW